MITDLFPTVRMTRAHLIESAVEAVEYLGLRGEFSINDVVDATSRVPRQFSAARQVLKTLEAHDLIQRVSKPLARPTLYRIAFAESE